MIKKIDIMGIQLDNYTVREAIMIVEKMLSNNVFNTLQEVYMNTLIMAGEEEDVRTVLETLDHTVIAEKGILEATGEDSLQRIHEIEDCDFFYELFKRVERNYKKVFIIAETEAAVEEMTQHLQESFPRIEIVGSRAMEDYVGEAESLVNAINSETVDVILSLLPSPTQEKFLLDNKDKLSANLWYGIGDNKFGLRGKGISGGIANKLKVRKLAKHINNYEEKEKANNEFTG